MGINNYIKKGRVNVQTVTLKHVLISLRKCGKSAQARKMLKDVIFMVKVTSKKTGLSSLLPCDKELKKELLRTPMDNIILLAQLYRTEKRLAHTVPVQVGVQRRVSELRNRGWYVVAGDNVD